MDSKSLLFDPTSQKSYSWHNDEKVRYKGDVTIVKHTLFYFSLAWEYFE
jgi:hypothetical protein